jgi:hypothetical protein
MPDLNFGKSDVVNWFVGTTNRTVAVATEHLSTGFVVAEKIKGLPF